jgi:transcriptional regulator with XRE-family HTH domain
MHLLSPTTPARYTGFELKVMRLARGVHQRSIADVLGVSRARISNIEQAAHVPASTAERYLGALAQAVSAFSSAGGQHPEVLPDGDRDSAP